MNSNNPPNFKNSKNSKNSKISNESDINNNKTQNTNDSNKLDENTNDSNKLDEKTNGEKKIQINNLNDYNNDKNMIINKKNSYNSKNNKKKNRKKLQEQIKEEYNNYIEYKNTNDFYISKSIDDLMALNETENKDKIIDEISPNHISKSKSLNNFKVKEMKNIIRKNSSYNMVGDIIFEINNDSELTNIFQQVKKIKSSGSLNNINLQMSPKNKYTSNESNRFSYLIEDDDIGLNIDEQENSNEKKNNEFIILRNQQNNQNNNQQNNKINKKNKNSNINFEEIKDLENKINSVVDYHLINTPFKMIGEEILNDEINGKYKSKIKTNPENEQIIRKLKDTFKKLVYREVKEKPNISQILLDNSLNEDLKVKIIRKYIKFTTEDEVFSDEADKIKIEIKNLLKQKKLRQSDDYEELGKQIESKIMPTHLKIKLEDIYYRVIGGDQPKLHNLLNNLIKLPFEKKKNILDEMSNHNVPKEDKIQFIKNLYSKLDADLYGLEETKDSIISWICQKINNPTQKSCKYLCLCGPAGVGKTSIIHSISESLGIPYSYISLANIDEPGSLIGHGYTYEGSQCGSVANGLISNGCINGILLFDELDKTKEKVQNTLLGIFDPLQNTKFRDAYFGEFNLNLSESMMIVCLNNIANVNPILKDRLHIVNIPGYTTKDKKIIISKYILPKLNTQYNLNKIEIEEKVIDEIINQTKIFEGIRQIQMYITKIYELVTLDEYTNKYNFNGVFGMKYINLLKFHEQNHSFLSLYT